jgi:hypothetical protein
MHKPLLAPSNRTGRRIADLELLQPTLVHLVGVVRVQLGAHLDVIFAALQPGELSGSTEIRRVPEMRKRKMTKS